MIRRLKSQVIKELLSYLRDPKSRAILIGPPLMQLLIFSFAATLSVRNVDLAVYDADAGRWSTEVVARLEGASFVDEVIQVSSPAELGELIDERRVLAALSFPADFSRDVAAGRPAELQVIVDGRSANSGQVALSYIEAITSGLGVELAGGRGDPAATGGAVVRHFFNPNLIYQWFVVPSLAGILAMIISLLVTSLSIARERELGTFDQLLVSPAKPLEIIAGKTLPALILGSLLAGVMITAGIFVFRVPFNGSLGLLVASLVLFILSVVGIGLAISSISQTQQQAILGAFSVAVPVILTSGFATPVENMPAWLQVVAQVNPLKHFLLIVQGTFLKALPPTDVFHNAWPMAAIALVTLTSAVLFVQRKLQ